MDRSKGGLGSRGAAAVEFAIVLPLLLLILFGIIEFSLIMYDRIQIASATRELARYASVFTPPDLEEDPTLPRRSADDISTYASALYDSPPNGNGNAQLELNELGVTSLGNYVTSPGNALIDPDDYVLSTCPNVCASADCFAEIRMEFTHEYLLFVPFVRTLNPSASWASITLAARTRMRCE